MRRSQCQSRAQLVLELERPKTQEPLEQNTEGLIEILADLLLEALSADAMKTGGEDERQNHA